MGGQIFQCHGGIIVEKIMIRGPPVQAVQLAMIPMCRADKENIGHGIPARSTCSLFQHPNWVSRWVPGARRSSITAGNPHRDGLVKKKLAASSTKVNTPDQSPKKVMVLHLLTVSVGSPRLTVTRQSSL